MENSSFGRLLGALVSPGKTFRSIAERPTWGVALVALLLVGTLSGVLANKKIDPNDMREMIEQRMEKQGGGQKPSAAQLDQAAGMAQKWGSIVVWLAPIFSAAAYLIMALLFWAAFRFVAASSLTYKTSFSVLLHAFMPWLIAGLLTLPVILSREHIGVQEAQQGLLASNLSAFAPEGAGGALKSLLGSLDFFSLWTVVLLILGYRTAAKASTASSATIILVVWLLYVGIKVGLGAAFG
jgi:hypothetical protein